MNDDADELSVGLAQALHTALGNAIADARTSCPGEHFYAYVLYTSPLFEYAAFFFNTEERLAHMSCDNRERGELLWSPPDWECAEGAEKCFERANEILYSLTELQGYEDAGCAKRKRVFMEVLEQLDSQGVFGAGASRELAVVNIMWGDQDVCAHVESARELNPIASYLAYARHVLPAIFAWEKEIEASRSMYKDEALAGIRRTIARVERDLATLKET